MSESKPLGIIKSTTHCIGLGIETVTLAFQAVNNIVSVGEAESEVFKLTSMASVANKRKELGLDKK